MKVIIAGSRSIAADVDMIDEAVKESGYLVTEVISGMAKGPDMAAVAWAEANGIPCTKMPADWKKYGKRAGFLRNAEMAKVADALIALWDAKSGGTRNMIAAMQRIPKPMFVKLTCDITVENPRMVKQVFGFTGA